MTTELLMLISILGVLLIYSEWGNYKSRKLLHAMQLDLESSQNKAELLRIQHRSLLRNFDDASRILRHIQEDRDETMRVGKILKERYDNLQIYCDTLKREQDYHDQKCPLNKAQRLAEFKQKEIDLHGEFLKRFSLLEDEREKINNEFHGENR